MRLGQFVDPNPRGSAFIRLSWMRIRIGNMDPDPGARKYIKNLFYTCFSTYVGMFYDLHKI
jgi:hypothetical protein